MAKTQNTAPNAGKVQATGIPIRAGGYTIWWFLTRLNIFLLHNPAIKLFVPK